MGSNIRIDTSKLNKITRDLGKFEKQMPKAAVSAVNRTLSHVYTKVPGFVKEQYNIKPTEIKDTMRKIKAHYRNLNAYIIIRSRRFTLGRFLRGGGLNSMTKKPKVKIKREGSYKLVGGKAFVRRVTRTKKNGEKYTNTLVLERQGKSRYPLDVLRTISPTQMVENPKVQEKIQEIAQKKLEERITHEIDYRLKKMGAK